MSVTTLTHPSLCHFRIEADVLKIVTYPWNPITSTNHKLLTLQDKLLQALYLTVRTAVQFGFQLCMTSPLTNTVTLGKFLTLSSLVSPYVKMGITFHRLFGCSNGNNLCDYIFNSKHKLLISFAL